MTPVVFVGTNTPSTLNIPRPGIDFGFALDRCHGPLTFVFFVSNTFGQSKKLMPSSLLITYVTRSGLVSVPAAPSPMPIMTHPLMVVNS